MQTICTACLVMPGVCRQCMPNSEQLFEYVSRRKHDVVQDYVRERAQQR